MDEGTFLQVKKLAYGLVLQGKNFQMLNPAIEETRNLKMLHWLF